MRAHLHRAGIAHELHRVGRGDELARVAARGHDLILADFSPPGLGGLEALRIAREVSPTTPFIFLSGTPGEEAAVEALKQGADDYVLKERLQRLPAAVQRALDEALRRRRQREALERQKLLVTELRLRLANALTTVLSIARQTLQRSRTLVEFEAAFTGRLRALAETHGVLLRAGWQAVELTQLVRLALDLFEPRLDQRVELEGPDVRLEPALALPLGMVLHELASNATRHGALRDPAGRVRLRWSVAGGDQPQLSLLWTERNGPPVTLPAQEGFGITLIRQGAVHELGGAAILSFSPAGFACDISLPLGSDVEAGPTAAI